LWTELTPERADLTLYGVQTIQFHPRLAQLPADLAQIPAQLGHVATQTFDLLTLAQLRRGRLLCPQTTCRRRPPRLRCRARS
jgi:hypothetical protein